MLPTATHRHIRTFKGPLYRISPECPFLTLSLKSVYYNIWWITTWWLCKDRPAHYENIRGTFIMQRQFTDDYTLIKTCVRIP